MTFIIVKPLNHHARKFRSYSARFLAAGCCLLLAAICQPALAAPINYGDFSGNTVEYTDVTEDSNSGDATPLFGAPTVSGDSLDFNPVGFSANSKNGAADITDGQLKFGVVAKDPIGSDFGIQSITLSESGDTTMAGIGTDSTTTAVFGYGVVDIYEVDGIAINNISVPFSLTFNPSGGTFGLGTDGGGGPVFSTSWSGSATIDLDAILTANSVPFVVGATRINVNLDNTLLATSETGTETLIAKKDFGGLSVTVNKPDPGEIPEPTTLMLVALAVMGSLFTRIRN